jgi:hypothetical protein
MMKIDTIAVPQRNMTGQVVLRLQDPIHKSASASAFLMPLGLSLLSYPVFWILMLQYQRDAKYPPATILETMTDAVGYWVLHLVPLLANGGLALFLAAFFFFIGRQKQVGKMR